MSTDRTWIRGVSQPLPEGETLLWEGAPDRKALARHALHVRIIAGYFAVIIAAGLVGALRDQVSMHQLLVTLATQVGLSAVVVGGVLGYAALTASNTVYAITSRRVVMKVGIVLPTTINIPFHLVESASAAEYRDGTGQIALALRPPDRLAFVHLWPHARAWHLRFPQPALRGLTDTRAVAAIIRDAAAAAGPVTTDAPVPADQGAPASPRMAPSLSTAHEGAAR
jgi:hypothetical protein